MLSVASYHKGRSVHVLLQRPHSQLSYCEKDLVQNLLGRRERACSMSSKTMKLDNYMSHTITCTHGHATCIAWYQIDSHDYRINCTSTLPQQSMRHVLHQQNSAGRPSTCIIPPHNSTPCVSVAIRTLALPRMISYPLAQLHVLVPTHYVTHYIVHVCMFCSSWRFFVLLSICFFKYTRIKNPSFEG